MQKSLCLIAVVSVTLCNAPGCTTVDSDPPVVLPATLIEQSAARYPLIALATCTTGFADVRFEVDTRGMVQNAVVTDAQPSTVFNDSAVAAVSSWRFSPRVENGKAVISTLTQKIEFAAPSNCMPFDTQSPQDGEFDENAARNACFESGGYQWGYAELYFVVDANGAPGDVRVHRATAEDLELKARAALATEQFDARFIGQTLSRVLEYCSR